MDADVRFRFVGSQFQAVYSDQIADVLPKLGGYTVTRASHVEPDGNGWIADMRPSGGPVLLASDGHPFTLRQEALDAERQWLRDTWGL